MLSKFPIDPLLLFPACRQNSNVNKNNRVDEAEVKSAATKLQTKENDLKLKCCVERIRFKISVSFFLIQIRITIESQMTLNYNG